MTRLATGGRIDRSRPLRFTLDGVEHTGFAGDTLASAMVAAGLLQVAPSLYRRRPRGIVAADVTEPNALMQVESPYHEPMLPATTVELVDGLIARTLRAVGRLPDIPVGEVYDKTFTHADVAIVGAGPTGLAAALAAAAGDARVLLIDDGAEVGGDLLTTTETLDGLPAAEWAAHARDELGRYPQVQILTRTSVVGYYDQNYLLAVQRRTDHLPAPHPEGISRQRLWHIRAKRVVLATGAHERPLVFAGNDRPGVMLAGAVRRYVLRHAASPGERLVVTTTNDTAYETVLDLAAAGVVVSTLVDSRSEPPHDLVAQVSAAGVEVLTGSVVTAASGTSRVSAATVHTLLPDGSAGGTGLELPCDVLAVSGGWNPDVHLFSQSRGTVVWDAARAAFVPGAAAQAVRIAGSANGQFDLASCLTDGADAGHEAAHLTGWPAPNQMTLPASGRRRRDRADDRPVWVAPDTAARSGAAASPSSGPERASDERFVDLQRDATVSDVHRAVAAGMQSVEHVKRYTTIGTGHDQGRTSGVAAIGVIAEALGGRSPGDVGTTTFRAPSVPVLFSAMAGRDVALTDPVRTTPIHSWHVAAGAVFEDVGQWKRPHHYPRAGESPEAAVLRECAAARTSVAVMDASTLGKIDVVGADAGEFLNRIYTNAFAGLAVGSARYGLMCHADGMVMDDGVAMRLATNRFTLTTTTGGAAHVLDWLEEWHQTEWPHLDVHLTSVTEQWATIAVVGPRAREVVGRLAPDVDVAREAFPFMTFRETTLPGGVPARIARVSFSGELAYEVNVSGWYGLAVWEAVMAAGADFDITPYGTETMHVLRAEKGFAIVGQDTDGTVTPLDLGMAWIVSKKKDFVGKRSLSRPDTARTDRRHLVGLLPVDPTALLPEGAQLVAEDTEITPHLGPVPMLGHVTSSYRSAALGRTFALALVQNGRHRHGETVVAPVGDRPIAAIITDPVFYDPEGARRDG